MIGTFHDSHEFNNTCLVKKFHFGTHLRMWNCESWDMVSPVKKLFFVPYVCNIHIMFSLQLKHYT